MGLNAKEFSASKGVSYWKIAPWFEAGYLGSAVRDEKTRVYDIPEDTPIPFKANSRISKLTSFWKQILQAAENQNSLFSSMYPKLQAGTFDRYINDFVDAGFIRIENTASGAKYLELCPAGQKYLTELTEKEQDKILNKIEKGVASGMTVAQTICAAWPIIQPFITGIPTA